MAVSGTIGSGPEIVYLKGSIDSVLERCSSFHQSDQSTPQLTVSLKSTISHKASEIASKGLRVVAMAYGSGSASSVGQSLVFAGFQAMLDPPRQGVAEAISALQTAGIHVVMITGDAEETATSIARDLGLRMTAGKESCLTGKAIDQMSQQQLREAVGHIAVFARVTPKHKMSIIEAFQANGDVVAMTGDGGGSISCGASLSSSLDPDSPFPSQSTTHPRSRWPTLVSQWARVGPMSQRRQPT